jgi:hypothetical protein
MSALRPEQEETPGAEELVAPENRRRSLSGGGRRRIRPQNVATSLGDVPLGHVNGVRSAGFRTVGQRLDEVAASQWVDRVGAPRLMGDDLLGPQGDADRFSVGSASASSWLLVCSDCVPPSTAPRASIAVRVSGR